MSLALVGIISLSLLGYSQYTAQTEVEGFTTEPTTMTFLVLDHESGVEIDDDDYEIYIFSTDISDITDPEDLEDLTYADYGLEKSVDAGDIFTPEADHIYYARINGSDIDPQWFVPALGLNTKFVMNSTESMVMVCYGKNDLSPVMNQTNQDKLILNVQTLDEDGDLTYGEGFLPYYDFENDEEMYFMVRVEFNTTADTDFVELDSASPVTVSASGNYVYFEIDVAVVGMESFVLDFDNELGETFEAIGVAVGTGYSGSMTVADSQN